MSLKLGDRDIRFVFLTRSMQAQWFGKVRSEHSHHVVLSHPHVGSGTQWNPPPHQTFDTYIPQPQCSLLGMGDIFWSNKRLFTVSSPKDLRWLVFKNHINIKPLSLLQQLLACLQTTACSTCCLTFWRCMDSVPGWMHSENYFSQLINYSRPFILIKLLITELEKGRMEGNGRQRKINQ